MTGNYSTREYREKLYDDLHVRLRDTVILMCAIFIASIGLNMNSTAVIIGAMLISPLMTPIEMCIRDSLYGDQAHQRYKLL